MVSDPRRGRIPSGVRPFGVQTLTNLTMCKLNNRYHDTYGLTPHLCVDCETIEVDHIDWMCDTCLTNYNTGNDVDPWINYTPAETAEYIKRFKERESAMSKAHPELFNAATGLMSLTLIK